ncbi:MAG TPA: hypothetical protein VN786_01555 [Acidimicrobiales bacterium]|nr:hypothetical protein [Acidimicrobiales bacterium]
MDQLFASVGIGPFTNDDAEDRFDRAVPGSTSSTARPSRSAT